MNNRQLTVAVAVLVVLGSLFFIVSRKRAASWRHGTDAIVKNPLVENLDVNSVAKLTLKGPKGTVSISRSKDGWSIEERGGFPADFGKVRRLLVKLPKLEVIQRPRVVESQLAELGLLKPDQKKKKGGVELRLADANGDVMLGLILGDVHTPPQKGPNPYGTRQEPDGRYVLVDGSKSPVLISDALLHATTNPSDWIDPSAIKIMNVVSMALLGPDSKKEWEILRKSQDAPWVLDGITKDEDPKPYPMSKATGVFYSLRLDDVILPDSKKAAKLFDKSKTLVVRTADKFVYKIKVAVKDDKGYIKYDVSADIPEKPASNVTQNDAAKKAWKEHREELLAKLAREKMVSKWIFEYPKYKVDPLLKKRSDFVKKKKKQDKKADGKNPSQGQ